MSAQMESQSVLSAMLDPNELYVFRIPAAFSITANGSGVMAAFENFDPSASTQWSAISSLFGMCRLKETTLTWVNQNPFFNNSGGSAYPEPPVVISANSSINGVIPLNYDSVIGVPTVRMFSLASPATQVMSYKSVKNLNFASTASPAVGPYAGCWGQWSIFANTLANGEVYGTYIVVKVVELSARN